jgi:hypothetical protein
MNEIGKTFERSFELIPVPEDGNCMYHAILATKNSLRPVPADHHTLIALVVEELLHNRDKYLQLFDEHITRPLWTTRLTWTSTLDAITMSTSRI